MKTHYSFYQFKLPCRFLNEFIKIMVWCQIILSLTLLMCYSLRSAMYVLEVRYEWGTSRAYLLIRIFLCMD